jgi:hypothetical protein
MIAMEDKLVSKAREYLKGLSSKDFLGFGLNDLAYIKPVELEEGTAWAVYAADGKPVSVLDTRENAIALILHNELEPVTLQ